MQDNDLWQDSAFNRTDKVYTFPNRSYIEFFSLDNPGKARGPGRDLLFINEANLIGFEIFNQLLWRTRQKVFIDYNPADEYHWIYDKVLTRDDCKFIQSTYLDNPFLPPEQVAEIERIKELDENYWRVYGLGERGQSSETIYTSWTVKNWRDVSIIDWCYGLDFGYNVPTALVKVGFPDNGLIFKEVIYQSSLTNADLIAMLRDVIPQSERRIKKIYADAAEPQRIEEIRRAGFVIEAALKDVAKGIDYVKAQPLFITQDSINILKEIKSYKYKKDKGTGQVLDDPVKLNDHALDAARYAVASYRHKPKPGANFGNTRPNRYNVK